PVVETLARGWEVVGVPAGQLQIVENRVGGPNGGHARIVIPATAAGVILLFTTYEPNRSPPFPFDPRTDGRVARRRVPAGCDRLRAGRPRARAGVHSAVAGARRLRPAGAGGLSRASGPRG